jgi:hypothetical protein
MSISYSNVLVLGVSVPYVNIRKHVKISVDTSVKDTGSTRSTVGTIAVIYMTN